MIVLIWFSLAMVSAAQAQSHSALVLNPELGKISGHCKSSASSKKHIWLFKQWHLTSGVKTPNLSQAKLLPQTKNQTAIYRQLDQWLKSKKIDTVVAEGCSGELMDSSALQFNGWSLEALRAQSKLPHYDDEVVTSVPFKLKAQYGQSLHAYCGDDEKLLRENGLAFSDARGTVGFMTRLEQHKNDPIRAKTYLDGVIQLYHLPKRTTIDQAMTRLGLELRQAVERIHAGIDQRNQKAIEALKKIQASDIAMVYGGLHASGLVHLLENAGIDCTVVEPEGYQNSDVEMLERLDQLLAKK